MVKCAKCGGKLRRVHRTFYERLGYMAIYECRRCQEEQVVLRRYRYHFGAYTRCPHCGTFKVTRLKEPDRIDPMVRGVLNIVERLVGGNRLCHCRYCRIQFYDRREISASGPAAAAVSDPQAYNAADADFDEPPALSPLAVPESEAAAPEA